MSEGALSISRHAATKFRSRSRQMHLSLEEARRNMRYLVSQGETGEREGQPVVRSDGWIFVMSDDLKCVITCFYNPNK